METSTLESFVQTVLRDKRIRFGDVRRLQRNVLASGIASREEAETLLALDRSIAKPDPAWTDFLVTAIRRFVVEIMEPKGFVDSGKTDWLADLAGDPPSKAVRTIAREVAITARDAGDIPTGVVADGADQKPQLSW